MQYRIEYEYLLRFQMIFEREDIIEYRTTWNNELFFKNKSICITAKRLIKKSIFIGKINIDYIQEILFSLLSSNTIMSTIEIFRKEFNK